MLGIFVAVLWIIPSGSMFIALISGVCDKVDTDERVGELDLIMFAVNIPVPFTEVIVNYTWIYVHIKKHFKTQKQHLINLRATSPQESVISEEEITVTTPRINNISWQRTR